MESGLAEEDLPDILDITREDHDEFFPIWLIWLGTGRKFLPRGGGLEMQSSRCMTYILKMDGVYEKLLAEALKERNKEKEAAESV